MHLFKYVNSTQFLQRGVTVNKEPLLTHAWENWFEKTKNMHTTSGYYLTATLKQKTEMPVRVGVVVALGSHLPCCAVTSFGARADERGCHGPPACDRQTPPATPK